MIMAGRGRWKIENEGFNSQKNGIYNIEHLNSRNSNAMKKPLSPHSDIRYFNAAVSGMESRIKETKTEHKKYIFKATGKFPTTNSNG